VPSSGPSSAPPQGYSGPPPNEPAVYRDPPRAGDPRDPPPPNGPRTKDPPPVVPAVNAKLAASVADVDVAAPTAQGQLELVKLVAPEIDAMAQLGVDVEDIYSGGHKYAFTNRGASRVEMWIYKLTTDGIKTMAETEVSTLDPGQWTSATVKFVPQPRPNGTFRIVIVCVDQGAFGDDHAQRYTKAGDHVRQMLGDLDARIGAPSPR
jgi:hypothetical protein